MNTYYCLVFAVLQRFLVISRGESTLNITDAGTMATFECSSPNANITLEFSVLKDKEIVYNCIDISFTCRKFSADPDYTDIIFTDLGTKGAKGTFTVTNPSETRDGGCWTCQFGSPQSEGKAYPVIDPTTTAPTTAASIPETKDEHLYLLFLLVLIPCIVLIVVIIIVSGYKTLVISTLYVKVYKNTVQLSWKPFGFEPVPDTLYAKCAQNGLTENAECIDGLFVVVFRDLVPGQQHDVTVYCQNAADMKLYKSETCVVFTLKDSSNPNPKESKAVLALHSLDLTVYQTKVELSWTSPLAFDSTKVEYWVGADKHITMSADKTSLATSNAEMTRLLPDSVITFTITGVKNGTQYRSGVLHQKTLKCLTGCCP